MNSRKVVMKLSSICLVHCKPNMLKEFKSTEERSFVSSAKESPKSHTNKQNTLHSIKDLFGENKSLKIHPNKLIHRSHTEHRTKEKSNKDKKKLENKNKENNDKDKKKYENKKNKHNNDKDKMKEEKFQRSEHKKIENKFSRLKNIESVSTTCKIVKQKSNSIKVSVTEALKEQHSSRDVKKTNKIKHKNSESKNPSEISLSQQTYKPKKICDRRQSLTKGEGNGSKSKHRYSSHQSAVSKTIHPESKEEKSAKRSNAPPSTKNSHSTKRRSSEQESSSNSEKNIKLSTGADPKKESNKKNAESKKRSISLFSSENCEETASKRQKQTEANEAGFSGFSCLNKTAISPTIDTTKILPPIRDFDSPYVSFGDFLKSKVVSETTSPSKSAVFSCTQLEGDKLLIKKSNDADKPINNHNKGLPGTTVVDVSEESEGSMSDISKIKNSASVEKSSAKNNVSSNNSIKNKSCDQSDFSVTSSTEIIKNVTAEVLKAKNPLETLKIILTGDAVDYITSDFVSILNVFVDYKHVNERLLASSNNGKPDENNKEYFSNKRLKFIKSLCKKLKNAKVYSFKLPVFFDSLIESIKLHTASKVSLNEKSIIQFIHQVLSLLLENCTTPDDHYILFNHVISVKSFQYLNQKLFDLNNESIDQHIFDCMHSFSVKLERPKVSSNSPPRDFVQNIFIDNSPEKITDLTPGNSLPCINTGEHFITVVTSSSAVSSSGIEMIPQISIIESNEDENNRMEDDLTDLLEKNIALKNCVVVETNIHQQTTQSHSENSKDTIIESIESKLDVLFNGTVSVDQTISTTPENIHITHTAVVTENSNELITETNEIINKQLLSTEQIKVAETIEVSVDQNTNNLILNEKESPDNSNDINFLKHIDPNKSYSTSFLQQKPTEIKSPSSASYQALFDNFTVTITPPTAEDVQNNNTIEILADVLITPASSISQQHQIANIEKHRVTDVANETYQLVADDDGNKQLQPVQEKYANLTNIQNMEIIPTSVIVNNFKLLEPEQKKITKRPYKRRASLLEKKTKCLNAKIDIQGPNDSSKPDIYIPTTVAMKESLNIEAINSPRYTVLPSLLPKQSESALLLPQSNTAVSHTSQSQLVEKPTAAPPKLHNITAVQVLQQLSAAQSLPRQTYAPSQLPQHISGAGSAVPPQLLQDSAASSVTLKSYDRSQSYAASISTMPTVPQGGMMEQTVRSTIIQHVRTKTVQSQQNIMRLPSYDQTLQEKYNILHQQEMQSQMEHQQLIQQQQQQQQRQHREQLQQQEIMRQQEIIRQQQQQQQQEMLRQQQKQQEMLRQQQQQQEMLRQQQQQQEMLRQQQEIPQQRQLEQLQYQEMLRQQQSQREPLQQLSRMRQNLHHQYNSNNHHYPNALMCQNNYQQYPSSVQPRSIPYNNNQIIPTTYETQKYTYGYPTYRSAYPQVYGSILSQMPANSVNAANGYCQPNPIPVHTGNAAIDNIFSNYAKTTNNTNKNLVYPPILPSYSNTKKNSAKPTKSNQTGHVVSQISTPKPLSSGNMTAHYSKSHKVSSVPLTNNIANVNPASFRIHSVNQSTGSQNNEVPSNIRNDLKLNNNNNTTMANIPKQNRFLHNLLASTHTLESAASSRTDLPNQTNGIQASLHQVENGPQLGHVVNNINESHAIQWKENKSIMPNETRKNTNNSIEKDLNELEVLLNIQQNQNSTVIQEPQETSVSTIRNPSRDSGYMTPSKQFQQDETCSYCLGVANFLCSGCVTVYYCSEDCQTKAWPSHQDTCYNEK